MAYFLAPSLVDLRDEINSINPKRDKTSDGWIGDASHQARKSDHNPDYDNGGIVRAIDVDEDGIDANAIIKKIQADPRVAYIIYERRIWTKSKGWQAYSGVNPHDKHFHVSILHTSAAAASGSWGIKGGKHVNDSKPATVTPSSSGGSIVDYLNSLGKKSDFASRQALAIRYGISGYRGTAAQNTALLNKLRSGLGTSTKPKKVTGSIVDYLNSKKQDSSFAARKKLATKHGIKNYRGTASQNALLLSKIQD